LIHGLHWAIGSLARQPHWFVNDAEARQFGQAMVNAARHFPLHATQKTIDVAMLVMIAFSIEMPRIGISMQIAKGKASPPRRPAQTFQFNPFINPNAASPPSPSPPSPPPAASGASGGPPAADAPPSAAYAAGPHDASSDIDAIGGAPP
jgi:hypothetical protein